MAADPRWRNLALGYGIAMYLLAVATVLYAVGFLANAVVPTGVDTGPRGAFGPSLVVDVGLIGLFALQHSLMARPGFKARWTRLVPEPAARSTYVLVASLALWLLVWFWRPLPGVVWHVEGPLAWVLWLGYLGGWALMFAAVNMIDGFELLGLRPVLAYRAGRERGSPEFVTPLAYRYVRHPIMTGFLVAFWVTPRMTVGHLLFAAGMTGYLLVGVRLEERDLVATFGAQYRRYQRAVPAFVPRPGRSAGDVSIDNDGAD